MRNEWFWGGWWQQRRRYFEEDTQRRQSHHDTHYLLQEINQTWPQLFLATKEESKNGRDQTSETGHQPHQEGSWWWWKSFLARGSFNEMLRQIYRVYTRKTIGNSHGTVIFSAMRCQTRTTSYCWLLEIKRWKALKQIHCC